VVPLVKQPSFEALKLSRMFSLFGARNITIIQGIQRDLGVLSQELMLKNNY
jgi:hypothetical protein